MGVTNGERAWGRALLPTSPPNKGQTLARRCCCFNFRGWVALGVSGPLWTSAFLAVKWAFLGHSLAVQWSGLGAVTAEARVRSLVGELRSHEL